MPFSSRRSVLLSVCPLVMLSILISVSFASAAAAKVARTAQPQAAQNAQASVTSFLNTYLSAYSSGVYGAFHGGQWANTQDDSCWACDAGGAMTAAATAYAVGGYKNQALYAKAVTSAAYAIAHRQLPNGGFASPRVAGEVDSEDIDTAWYGDELGTVYDLLAKELPARTRQTWQQSLADAADFIENSGAASWYANGNINLAYTELFWLTWKATDDQRFLTDYNESWGFTSNPPQNRWPGAGWITVKAAGVSSGADGVGYFTESNGGKPGFDAEYSMIQLDVLARLYLLSRDPRVLKAANMVLNMEMPRINTHTWMLDASQGSRHPQPGRYIGWLTSAFTVLGLEGGRSGLLADIVPDLTAEETWFGEAGQADSPQFRRAFGSDLSVIALASTLAGSTEGPIVAKESDVLPALRRTVRVATKRAVTRAS